MTDELWVGSIDMPPQPSPNMTEWLPLWKFVKNRTEYFVPRFGLFMYWNRGQQGSRIFHMAVPIVRCFSLLLACLRIFTD